MNNKQIKVLSLFDGISGSQQALKNVGIKPDVYYSSEIEKAAIRVTQRNFPNTVQLGSVTGIDWLDAKFDGTDLLSGGSPCQNFSFGGKLQGLKVKNETITSLERYLELKNNGFEFTGQSYLFWEFYDALKLVEPNYFLLENVKMNKRWEYLINDLLGVEPIEVNSINFTAQKRKRLYWTNLPVDKEELLNAKDTSVVRDIIDPTVNTGWKDGTIYSITPTGRTGCSCIGGLVENNHTPWGDSVSSVSDFRQYQRIFSLDHKSPTLYTGIGCFYDFGGKYRRLTPLEMERLQGFPDHYTAGESDRARIKMIGNSWTIPVIEKFYKPLTYILK